MPAWSPDGRRLAFARYELHGAAPAAAELAAVSPDGRGLRGVSVCRPPTCGGDGSPGYSPDGAKLGFLRVTEHGGRIVFAVPDGSSPASLLRLDGLSVYSGPRWSRGATRIAFSAYRGGRGPINVYVVRADGTHLRRITDCRRPRCGAGYTAAAWSPITDELAVAATGMPSS